MEQQIGLIARSLPGRIGKQCQERYSFDCFIFMICLNAFSPLCKTKRGMFANSETHWLHKELIGYEADFEFIHNILGGIII